MIRIIDISDVYNVEDQLGEDGCVIQCYGLKFCTNNGTPKYIRRGDVYNGGIVVDCFAHPESDCIWSIIKCGDVYFDIEFIHNGSYSILEDPLPSPRKKIKDSTMLNGGTLW